MNRDKKSKLYIKSYQQKNQMTQNTAEENKTDIVGFTALSI